MTNTRIYSTSEAAEHLNVHARTVRKWIEAFADYVQPETNKRGHYQLTEDSLKALRNIHKHLREGNKSLKQVREVLIRSGELSPSQPPEVGKMTEENPRLDTIIQQITQLETVLEQLQQTVIDVHTKQDQLKFEIRNATFEQRLKAADNGKTKRKKEGMMRLSQLFR